jgi:sugar lactone lactonase YvrE
MVLRIVSLPTLNPTKCTFVGPGLKKLYISARSADRLSGSVFARGGRLVASRMAAFNFYRLRERHHLSAKSPSPQVSICA